MADRLFGIETEFGLVTGDGVAVADRDAVSLALIEQVHAVCGSVYDGGRGIFLPNGARFYVDAGHHPEWCGPECANPWDLVRYTLAGEDVLSTACTALATPEHRAPTLLKTNTDPVGVSWGCHESVMHRTSAETLFTHLVPFLVSRIVFSGAGGFACSPGLDFVISPRAHFLRFASSSDSTGCRGIFHTKQEDLSSHGYRRLHLVAAESLYSEVGTWLRSASLVMVVALIEGGVEPGTAMALKDPVDAMHAISRDLSLRLRVERTHGTPVTALEIQRHYWAIANAHAEAEFMPPWARQACDEWGLMLDRLERGPAAVTASLDWAIRFATYSRHLERRGTTWGEVRAWTRVLEEAAPDEDDVSNDFWTDEPDTSTSGEASDEIPAAVLAAAGLAPEGLEPFLRLRRELLEIDIRFGQVGEGSLFRSLDLAGVLDHHVPGVDNIEHAVHNPPAIGRAALRGAVIRRVQSHREHFEAGWDYVLDRSTMARLDLSHPLETDERWSVAANRQVLRAPSSRDRPRDTREEARRLLLAGDYPGAERLLLVLLRDEYEIPSVLIHLARLDYASAAHDRARQWIEQAWALRADAPRYIVGRTLWFKVLFALRDGDDPSPWLGLLKGLLAQPGARMDWTMEPVLAGLPHWASRSDESLLRALHGQLDGRLDPSELETLDVWCACEPRPLGAVPGAEGVAASG